ncbi:MAG: hypothetical protein ACFNTA_10635 [Campylobacter sp.]|uniref:hypothetical protein n=1 Tax=Campylobacter sp. TaxID=205 RepID=UPI0036192D4D
MPGEKPYQKGRKKQILQAFQSANLPSQNAKPPKAAMQIKAKTPPNLQKSTSANPNRAPRRPTSNVNVLAHHGLQI